MSAHGRKNDGSPVSSPQSSGSETGELLPSQIADEMERLQKIADATPDGQPDGYSETQDAFDEYVQDHLPTILAALRAQPQAEGEVPERETWWLAERVGHGQYAADLCELPALTDDPWRAVRFATEKEAFDFILRLKSLRDEMRQTEHVFINKFGGLILDPKGHHLPARPAPTETVCDQVQADSVLLAEQAIRRQTVLGDPHAHVDALAADLVFAGEAEYAQPEPSVYDQTRGAVTALTKFAAECHRAKWQFDLSEEFLPTRHAGKALAMQAFHELHRIGDLAIKLKDALRATPPTGSSPVKQEGRE